MVTLFCSPRPFVDRHTIVIQRNAIQSWLAMDPSPEVLLIGNDYGVAEIAHELSVTHIPDVETDSHGIPLRSSMCQIARDVAQYEHLCTINADIVILDNFYDALRSISLPQFVAAGQRYNVDVHEPIAFGDSEWRARLRDEIRRDAKLAGPSAIDYALYPKCISPPILPPFPVNSFGWDNWFLFQHRRRGIPVIDLTTFVIVVHQNHESSEQRRLKHKNWRANANAMSSLRRAGGFFNMMTLREASYVIGVTGLRRPRFPRRILSSLATNRLYRAALACKRRVQAIF